MIIYIFLKRLVKYSGIVSKMCVPNTKGNHMLASCSLGLSFVCHGITRVMQLKTCKKKPGLQAGAQANLSCVCVCVDCICNPESSKKGAFLARQPA